MRKTFGLILLGLGSFLLITALLATVYLPGVVRRTPVDVNSKTELSGEAAKIDATTGALGDVKPIHIVSITQADTDASDDDVVVFKNGTCVVFDEDGEAPECVDGEDPRLITASESTFATDRVTAEAVDNGDYLPDAEVQYEGLVNKWPFDSEKKNYMYFDTTTEEAVEAVYDGTEEIEGIETYRYKVNIDEAVIEVAEGTPGTYTNEVIIWVEPTTGSFVKQSQDQQRYLANRTKVLDLQAVYTDDEIKESADEAKDSASQLDLITGTVPLVGYTSGALALIAGIVLLVTARRKEDG